MSHYYLRVAGKLLPVNLKSWLGIENTSFDKIKGKYTLFLKFSDMDNIQVYFDDVDDRQSWIKDMLNLAKTLEVKNAS